MSYLIKLVTPPNGLVLDPFMGSGSTGLGAIETDNRFVGIELEQDHYEIAKKRIDERLCSTLETMME
jgi:site-specific DNA-methyltransferase (adenine-specific)